MPFSRRSRRRSRFSRRRRTRRTRRFSSRRSRGPVTVRLLRRCLPFADRYVLRLKYVDEWSGTTTGGSVGTVQQFNLNSIFDPNRTGTGHQPYGHDTLATIFARYRVFKTAWRVRFTAGGGFRAAVGPENNTGSSTSILVLGERPRYTVKHGDNGTPIVFNGRISLNRLNGSTATSYKADDRFQALFGSSPTELMVLNTLIDGDAGQAIAFGATITLQYWVECFDVIAVTQS